MNPTSYLQMASIKLIAIAIFIGAVFITIFAQYKHIQTLEAQKLAAQEETKQYIQALDYQNDALLKNKADYEAKMKDANKTSVRIQTEYKTRTQYIYQWEKKDENRTCDDAVSMLNRYPF